MFASAPILINFRDYCEESIKERIEVDRYFASLQHEVFFHQMGESEDMRASRGTAFSKS